MSELFCLSREGSSSTTVYSYYIDSSIDNADHEFSAYPNSSGGTWHSFKLPVGVVRDDPQYGTIYIDVYGYNDTTQELIRYEDDTRYTKRLDDGNRNAMGTSFEAAKPITYGTAIPFFNNIDDASAYSRGVEFDWSNWVGGKPLEYNWETVSSLSGNGNTVNLSTIKADYINDGSPVSDASPDTFNEALNAYGDTLLIKSLYKDHMNGVSVEYNIPEGTYSSIYLAFKIGSEPLTYRDSQFYTSLSQTGHIETLYNLQPFTDYYFRIFAVTSQGISKSNSVMATTGHPDGTEFEYTGEIQTFVAPKTGIYQLETWGAQGGDATDGTLTARGGYGAYAYGEVLLTQGETIYINVGGQNGYGGGGNYTLPNNE